MPQQATVIARCRGGHSPWHFPPSLCYSGCRKDVILEIWLQFWHIQGAFVSLELSWGSLGGAFLQPGWHRRALRNGGHRRLPLRFCCRTQCWFWMLPSTQIPELSLCPPSCMPTWTTSALTKEIKMSSSRDHKHTAQGNWKDWKFQKSTATKPKSGGKPCI